MKILFNRKSNVIDSNMSDSNVGGRPNKSSINHIWVINGIVHDHLSSVKKQPIVIQQYDFTQMFDGMNLREALSDIFNTGVEDDTLHLLCEDVLWPDRGGAAGRGGPPGGGLGAHPRL